MEIITDPIKQNEPNQKVKLGWEDYLVEIIFLLIYWIYRQFNIGLIIMVLVIIGYNLWLVRQDVAPWRSKILNRHVWFGAFQLFLPLIMFEEVSGSFWALSLVMLIYFVSIHIYDKKKKKAWQKKQKELQ